MSWVLPNRNEFYPSRFDTLGGKRNAAARHRRVSERRCLALRRIPPHRSSHEDLPLCSPRNRRSATRSLHGANPIETRVSTGRVAATRIFRSPGHRVLHYQRVFAPIRLDVRELGSRSLVVIARFLPPPGRGDRPLKSWPRERTRQRLRGSVLRTLTLDHDLHLSQDHLLRRFNRFKVPAREVRYPGRDPPPSPGSIATKW